MECGYAVEIDQCSGGNIKFQGTLNLGHVSLSAPESKIRVRRKLIFGEE